MSEEQQPQNTTVALIPTGLGMSVDKVIEASQDSSFVPWITLVQGSSDAMKKNVPEGVRAGAYVLGGRKILPDGWRAKPLGVGVDMIARQHATLDKPELESFTTDDAIWQQIEAARGLKDGTQARVGTDMLLWLPDEHTFGVFAFSNTYAREMPGLVEAYKAGNVVSFKSRLVGKKNEWFVPTITHARVDQIPLPTEAQTKAAIEYFFAPVLAYKAQKPATEPVTSRPR